MEEPLPAGGSCLLGSLNLAAFVKDGYFDYKEFDYAVKVAVRALNKVLDEGLEKHPLEEQRESVRKWRQIGLGIMGLADMLIKTGIKYGSDESISLCDDIGKHLVYNGLMTSSELARDYGCYEEFSDSVLSSSFYLAHENDVLTAMIERYGLKNSQLFTIAPTGTISTMLGISGGIEPIFANSYTRTTKSLHGEDVSYKVYTPIVEEYMKANWLQDENQLPGYFVTSSDLTVEERIAMQVIWQKHIDASISSTVNLPNSATVEDVARIYTQAWAKGLKGITVYRAGCAREGILITSEKQNTGHTQKREKNIGIERHLTTGCGSLHICAYFDENGDLKNTYLSKGSTGGCNNFMIGLSRTISLAARNGVGIQTIVDQLNSCGTCPSYAVRRATKKDVSPGSCCPVAIGKALIEMWEEANLELGHSNRRCSTGKDRQTIDFSVCPECGSELVFEGGCNTCKNCGWSKCQ